MISRELKKDILEGAKYFPVIAILGPRQSGKTTLAQMVFKNHAYLTLEDLDLRAAARRDPRTFLIANKNKYGIIIDEFQHVPELLSYIQTMADKEKQVGYFVLTGSQNFLMNQSITQSLAGRVSIHTLLPLSIDELKKAGQLPDEIEPMLLQGCYPAIYAQQVPPARLYANYMQTYIERDVRALTQITDLAQFQTFITLCATRVGQLINFTSLGAEIGLSDHTIKRWLSILQASYIIYLLHPYHTSFGKRLIKTPKLYFYDTGLMCYLLKIKEEDLALHPNKGNIFESFIISEIIKYFYNHGSRPNIYFWRDKSEHELDLIIEQGKNLIPLEIKASRTLSQRFFEGLHYWHELNPKTEQGFVVYAGNAQQTRGHSHVISWQGMQTIFKQLTL